MRVFALEDIFDKAKKFTVLVECLQ